MIDVSTAITPLATTVDSVTLRRADYEKLLEVWADAADLADHQQIAGDTTAGRRTAVPWELASRILDGDHPVRVWREHRGLSVCELARLANMTHGYVSDIERHRKKGSLTAMQKLAKALNITIDGLLE